MESVFNMVGLAAFGQVIANVGYDLRATRKGYPPRKYDSRSGNILYDMVLNSGKLVIDVEQAAEQYLNNDRKWKKTLAEAGNDALELAAMLTGAPYSGPKSDFYYPFKAAEKK